MAKGSIIKNSGKIHKSLKDRFKDMKLSATDIINDAAKLDYKLDHGNLSRYINKGGNTLNSLTDESIVWLCYRYSVKVQLSVESMNHEESDAIKRIKKIKDINKIKDVNLLFK